MSEQTPTLKLRATTSDNTLRYSYKNSPARPRANTGVQGGRVRKRGGESKVPTAVSRVRAAKKGAGKAAKMQENQDKGGNAAMNAKAAADALSDYLANPPDKKGDNN